MKAALLCLLYVVCSVSAALFSVDLGSEYVKVALIKPGRVPISIVHNELSKRKTAAAVAFQSSTRLYGEDALGLITKTPNRVFLRIRDYLGRESGDPFLTMLYGGDLKWKPAYGFVEDQEAATVRFDLGNEESLTTEEILGSLFSYLKAMTKEEAGETVVDCVIAVPAFFGPVQKRRILDAAKLAEINILAMVNAHGAAALQYGIEREFEPTPQHVIVYDMGANTIQVSLLSFSGYQSKQLGKKVMVGQFEVVDVAWNENLGGDHLDWALVHYFASRFNEKFNLDLYISNRAVMKLKKAVGKTKQVLSANSEAHLNVEELFDGKDFNDKITRAQFEEMNDEFFVKATEPLKLLLERNNVVVSNLTAVELIGGGTRVPKLQSVLSEALGNRPLDKHLDGDEAVVMGAGLVAANLSTIFRLRKFGYLDGVIHPMQLQVVEPENWKTGEDVTSLLHPKSLLPYLKRLPAKRVVNLFNLSGTDNFRFQINFNTSELHALPPGAKTDLYATYTVSGLNEAIKKLGEGGKIALHFITDLSGLLEVDRAEYVVEVIEAEPPAEAPVPLDEAQAPAATAENTKPAENETQPTKNETKSKQETKPKKTFNKSVLVVSEPVFAQPSMTASQLKTSKGVLRKYSKGEALKKTTEKAKNTLESYVVQSQNKIHDVYEVQQVTTAEQREEFLTQLTSVEDWLYMDGADATAEVFESKLKELQKLGEPIFSRASESIHRPLSVEQCKKTIDMVGKALNTWPEMKPWLKDDMVELAEELHSLRTWLTEKEEAQSQLEPHEQPVFTSVEVIQNLLKVEKIMSRINNKKPPKPQPPPEPTPTNDTVNATTNKNQTVEANGTETETDSLEGGTSPDPETSDGTNESIPETIHLDAEHTEL